MEELLFRMTCRICGKQGTQELFVKDKNMACGYRDKCKECHNKKNEEWRAENPDKHRQCQKNYYHAVLKYKTTKKHSHEA